MISLKNLHSVSNYVSLSRVLLALPIWIILGYYPAPWAKAWAIGLCLLAAYTDYLDGYFARKYDQISEIGKILDPFADKVTIALIFIRLYDIGLINDLMFWMVIGRDVLIFTGAAIASNKIGNVTPSNMVGKVTVTLIGFFIIVVFLGVDKSSLFYIIMYWATIIMVVVSFINYGIKAVLLLKKA